jgi:hypothetical protein
VVSGFFYYRGDESNLSGATECLGCGQGRWWWETRFIRNIQGAISVLYPWVVVLRFQVSIRMWVRNAGFVDKRSRISSNDAF